jgi:parvulin-like peptidyl-prolyl isomerase
MSRITIFSSNSLLKSFCSITLGCCIIGSPLLPQQAFSEDAVKSKDDQVAPTLAPDTVIAVVNGRKITVAEVDKQIEQKPNFAFFLENAKNNPKLINDLRRRVAYAMVNREILLEEAQKSKLVSAGEVDESVKKVIDGYGGKDKLAELLKSIKTDINTFETEIRKDFTINGYIDKAILKDIKIADEEVKQEFEKSPEKYAQKEGVKARHILVKVEANASEKDRAAAEAKINTLYKELTEGKKDFAELAKSSSECPSAAQGGDLGLFNRGAMVPEFETQAFSTKVGEISKPFKTQFGYHVLKVDEHSNAKAGDLSTSKEQIKEELIAKKRESLVEAKLAELRKGYAVSISI